MDHGNTGEIERKAFLFNVQKYNMYDGPGIRTLVFFKGCPLRCKWCSNPEGLVRKFQVMFKKNSCTSCGACMDVCPVGIHVRAEKTGTHEILRDKDCIGCMKCKNICPNAALTIAGEGKTISEILKIVEEDAAFYELSGGGVTLGGGEVTAQSEAALNLLMACKMEGINTAIETCGYTKTETILSIAEYVDLFLFDIKHMDPVRHNELTGVNNEQILANLKELLHRRYKVKVRMPMLKGINDSKEEIDAIIQFLMPYRDDKNFQGIDLLPYHKLGVNKYNQLDIKYPIEGDPSLKEEDLERIEGWMKEYQFPVNVVKH
ncbi:choline TMA-lyase-activating enzyme [Clostridium sp. E02]|uniref:choline TMA-lyase-activating enzyme n=1 Tax=Clostridium sp. E02 TaxID=2487134 RepID=UPI000F535243|nr:choline TMA-lyase-activating enzyme [Clostridium sp. E02]